MKYITYCRKSSEAEERQVQSIDSQLSEMQRLVARDGVFLDKVFTESMSAKAPGRPIFKEMINYIERNVCTIYVWKLDRLARNPKDGGEIQWLLDQGKVQEIRTFEKTFHNSSDDKFMMNLDFGMAKKYVDDLSMNVKRGIRTKLEKGEWSNLAPFGYTNDIATHLIVLNPIQAPLVAEMFRMYATGGYSIRQLTGIMYEKGMRTRRGAKVGKTRINCILINPFYYGMMKKDGVYYPGKHEPLISKEVFDRVQDIVNNRSNSRPKKLFFAHRGFVLCKVCGCMFTASLKKGHSYYYCTNGKGHCEQHKKYLRSEILDEFFSDIFGQIEFDEEIVEIMYQAAKEKIGHTAQYAITAISKLAEQRNLARGRQEKLLDSYLAGLTPESVYASKIKDISNEIIATEAEIKKLEVKQVQEHDTLELTKKYFFRSK